MRLSIVIPALNEAAIIERNVQQAFELHPLEVIVVDGQSEDETVDLARRAGARVISDQRGRGLQLNSGAREAVGDVVLFLHADCWLEAEAANQIEVALSDPRIVGGAFRQRIEGNRRVFRWLEWGNAARVRWLRLPYGDQGIFLRRSAFEELGGFPEVRLMEDVLLMQQVRRRGWRIALLDEPIHVDARRWEKYGVVRQTLRNWALLAALKLGVSPNRLAEYYAGPAVVSRQ